MKKMFALVILLSNVGAFATDASVPAANNNPLVGGRQQSSHQQFGSQQITGTKGQKYNYGDDANGNKPLVGGRQQSSQQQFGAQQVTGTKGQVPSQTGVQQNNPLVGGRQQSSDQVFGHSGQ